MRGRQKYATVSSDVSGIERSAIKFAVRHSTTRWQRRIEAVGDT